jgi:hypothetical protein
VISVIFLLASALGCSGSEIPRDPGSFDALESLQRAWLPASPDNLMTALVLRHTSDNFRGDCPVATETELERTFEGDCDGDFGESWLGSATVREDEDHMEFSDFGISYGGVTWTLDGEMDWSFPDLTEPDEQFGFDMDMNWTDGEVSFEARIEAEVMLDWNDGAPRFLWMEGEIGVGNWGTATLTSEIIQLGVSNGCGWPSEGALRLEGDNVGTIDFGTQGCNGECPTGAVDGESVGDLCLGDGLPKLVTPLYSDDLPDDTFE